jgi:hypothetical protein
MQNSKLEVEIIHSDIIPDSIVTSISEEITGNDISLVIRKVKSGPMACLEWYIPTAIAAYILKPYTDSILSEMGKDHYQGIKKVILAGARKLIGKHKMASVKVITSTDAPNKMKSNYSISFSALFALSSKFKIKFLFDDSLSMEELEDYVSKIADFILKNGDDEIMRIIRSNGNMIIMNMGICSYDKKTKEITVLNPIVDQGKNKEI